MRRFSSLSDDEQHNELLKGIYNQLATMNKFLEIITAVYTKLPAADLELIREHTESMNTAFAYDGDVFAGDNFDSRVGYTNERGLYITTWDNRKRTDWPLGRDIDYPRTEPINEEIGCFEKAEEY